MTERTTGRSLISRELFDKLTHRIVTDDKLDRELAERIVDQSLAFLSACAVNTGAPLAPSELVDIGWHTFLLHTRDYATFCDRIAGRFLHHVPTDPNDPNARGEAARDALTRTVASIDAAGFTVDAGLWPRSAVGSCTGCHNGCHNDPPPARQ
jgi:hypothetical protein